MSTDLDLRELLKLSERAKGYSQEFPITREFVPAILGSEGREFVGLIGPRGAGKTVALQQLVNDIPNSFYISLDLLPRDVDIFQLLEELTATYSVEVFLLDEVHYNLDVNKHLKNCYDFLRTRIIFSTSVALQMLQTATDLSRRVRILPVHYFSYREYLMIRKGECDIPKINISELADRISGQRMRYDMYFSEYLKGALCPFSVDVSSPVEALSRIIRRVISEDIPRIEQVTID